MAKAEIRVSGLVARPDYEEITWGEIRVGDVILPWNVEEVEVVGSWTVTLVGPVPLKPQVEYQSDRTPYWTRRDVDLPVRIRRRVLAYRVAEITMPPSEHR